MSPLHFPFLGTGAVTTIGPISTVPTVWSKADAGTTTDGVGCWVVRNRDLGVSASTAAGWSNRGTAYNYGL